MQDTICSDAADKSSPPVDVDALQLPLRPSREFAARHVELLTGNTDTPVCIRILGDGEPANMCGTIAELWPEIERRNLAGAQAYIVVNEGGHDATAITRVRALFIDGDDIPTPEWHVAPSFIVRRDDTHFHPYWAMTDCPLSAFHEAQERLRARYGTKDPMHDLPRILRLAGTLHRKLPPKGDGVTRLVTIEEYASVWLGASYTLQEVMGGLPEVAPPVKAATDPVDFAADTDIDIARARQWIDNEIAKGRVPIESDPLYPRDNTCYSAAGFMRDFGLSSDAALDEVSRLCDAGEYPDEDHPLDAIVSSVYDSENVQNVAGCKSFAVRYPEAAAALGAGEITIDQALRYEKLVLVAPPQFGDDQAAAEKRALAALRSESRVLKGLAVPLDGTKLQKSEDDPIAELALRQRQKWVFRTPEEDANQPPLTFFDDHRKKPIFPHVPGGCTIIAVGPRSSHKTGTVIKECLDAVFNKDAHVVYFAPEGAHGIKGSRPTSDSEIKNSRLLAACKQRDRTLADLAGHWHTFDRAPGLMTISEIDGFIEDCRAAGFTPDIIVIDTLTRAAGAVDISAPATGIGLTLGMERLAKAFDATVIAVTHPGKDQTKGAIGSSLVESLTFGIWQISFDDQHVRLYVGKLKDAAAEFVIPFKIEPAADGTPVVVELAPGEYRKIVARDDKEGNYRRILRQREAYGFQDGLTDHELAGQLTHDIGAADDWNYNPDLLDKQHGPGVDGYARWATEHEHQLLAVRNSRKGNWSKNLTARQVPEGGATAPEYRWFLPADERPAPYVEDENVPF
jgi:hypothetical protein